MATCANTVSHPSVPLIRFPRAETLERQISGAGRPLQPGPAASSFGPARLDEAEVGVGLERLQALADEAQDKPPELGKMMREEYIAALLFRLGCCWPLPTISPNLSGCQIVSPTIDRRNGA